jgi:hypothetical protein
MFPLHFCFAGAQLQLASRCIDDAMSWQSNSDVLGAVVGRMLVLAWHRHQCCQPPHSDLSGVLGICADINVDAARAHRGDFVALCLIFALQFLGTRPYFGQLASERYVANSCLTEICAEVTSVGQAPLYTILAAGFAYFGLFLCRWRRKTKMPVSQVHYFGYGKLSVILTVSCQMVSELAGFFKKKGFPGWLFAGLRGNLPFGGNRDRQHRSHDPHSQLAYGARHRIAVRSERGES